MTEDALKAAVDAAVKAGAAKLDADATTANDDDDLAFVTVVASAAITAYLNAMKEAGWVMVPATARCPRPCNDRPDDFTAADCVAAGECGCAMLAAQEG